jgi:prepilin-type N-terminal cleavage/methylation domain-containing protein
MNRPKRTARIRAPQAGFSLVEMMVALVAGLIVVGAVITFLMSSFKSNSDFVRSTRLTQELRNTLDLVSRDLQRAGYDDNALVYLGNTNASPFSPIHVNGSCILYAYDRSYPNGQETVAGTPGTLDVGNGEVRGLRLSTVTNASGQSVGVIEYAVSAGTTKPACDGTAGTYNTIPAACDATSTWCPLSDANTVDIDAFTITNNVESMADTTSTMGMRRLDLTLVGRLAGATDFDRTVRTSVKVRSDCIRSTGTYAACSNSP